MIHSPYPLILASSSSFRQHQLAKLKIPFQIAIPEFDETPIPQELPIDMAIRLAEGKARSVMQNFPHALIIGADQVAECRGQILGKPLSLDKAILMLQQCSGQKMIFYSALTLLNTDTQTCHRYIDKTTVTMRQLTKQQIMCYLKHEPDALYCAGSAKSEGLGALLIERIDSQDPNALIGLPIFQLINFLLKEGCSLL